MVRATTYLSNPVVLWMCHKIGNTSKSLVMTGIQITLVTAMIRNLTIVRGEDKSIVCCAAMGHNSSCQGRQHSWLGYFYKLEVETNKYRCPTFYVYLFSNTWNIFVNYVGIERSRIPTTDSWYLLRSNSNEMDQAMISASPTNGEGPIAHEICL